MSVLPVLYEKLRSFVMWEHLPLIHPPLHSFGINSRAPPLHSISEALIQLLLRYQDVASLISPGCPQKLQSWGGPAENHAATDDNI